MRLLSKSQTVIGRSGEAALWFCACTLLAGVSSAQCSNPTQVPNQTISSGTANYSDGNALAASAVVINGSASVTFAAGNCIDLQPGFRATAGTAAPTFRAMLATPQFPSPIRTGNRPNGTYWGGGSSGEQIDLVTGNLSFTLPILKAQGRGGWSASLALSYNSQRRGI